MAQPGNIQTAPLGVFSGTDNDDAAAAVTLKKGPSGALADMAKIAPNLTAASAAFRAASLGSSLLAACN